ncbi:CRISPR-associated protein Cas4 [Metallosphaera tengchongensis]|uniref:CRISPR-associated exonuclease Cas4 n=1 Tax=Metallosphaera tengchongensis TaxID=1532350 RepID=A0A6N0P052_9CREN|nr:CRISPR-associated protein Cas4 [Metallosphaera tengchongensis]QKR00731.1 CRISPR-associated protein Cas4 [Metallosphaera tengchongensis]
MEGPGVNVTVTDLKDFYLCKAIPWIRRRLGWREPITYSVAMGKEGEVPRLEGAKYEVLLWDPATALVGVVDAITEDRVYEFKRFTRGKVGHFRLQLLAYAYLANRNGYKIREAVLLMNGEERLRIEVNENHLGYVRDLTKKIREELSLDKPPVVYPSKRLCEVCQYKRVCLSTPYY